jgi:hypothetical protein
MRILRTLVSMSFGAAGMDAIRRLAIPTPLPRKRKRKISAARNAQCAVEALGSAIKSAA